MCRRGRAWPWTPGAGSPVVAEAGQHWHFVGDSISASLKWYAKRDAPDPWEDPPGPYFVDQIETLVGGSIDVTVSARAGERTVNAAYLVHEKIAIYRPDVVVVLFGMNDARILTPASVVGPAYESILYGIRAECPNAQILMMGNFLHSELWLSGPTHWNPTQENIALDAYDAALEPLCAEYGAAFAPFRPTALAWEEANNTPSPGVDLGLLTWPVDNFHPSSDGKLLMADVAMAHVVAA